MYNNSILTKIKLLINYIENNIKKDFILDDVSDYSGLSKFHLSRIFKSITGKPLMEYVRLRKLSSSTYELSKTDLKVIDVAIEYNFESDSSYIRAFKKSFGITPFKFRKGTQALNLIEKADITNVFPLGEGLMFKPNFIIKPKFYLAGLRYKINHQDNLKNNTASILGNDYFYNHRYKVRNAINFNTYIGFTRFSKEVSEFSYYLPSIQVSSLDEIPIGMESDIVTANKYVVFKYVGFCPPSELTYHNFKAIWDFVWHDWINSSGYVLADTYHFESINVDDASNNYCEVELYLPIKDK